MPEKAYNYSYGLANLFFNSKSFLGWRQYCRQVAYREIYKNSYALTFSSKSRNSFTREFSNLNITGWLIVGLAAVLIARAYLNGLWSFRTGSASLISVLRGFQSIFVFILSLVLSIWLPKILKEELASGVLLTKVIAIYGEN